ncbi:MAG: prolipoprotein diacylglyceryl transferase [Lachnospiraceae bacterium]|nr:prolipoprotein diacylglyceryl transferase [Lachnospiraceae bacterium]
MTNMFNVSIANMRFPIYSTIVIGSIILGIVMACIIMYREGLKRSTIIYTCLLTFVCILVFGLGLNVTLTGNLRSIGFTGAGGALGLLIGACASIFIHRDHEEEMLASWVVSAPLMYGLAKTACHVAGCCYGIPYHGRVEIIYESDHISRFPVQLTESAVFTLIFLIGLILLLATSKPILTSKIVIAMSVIGKFSLDYLRASHYESETALSENQILALCMGILALVLINTLDRIFLKKKGIKNG